MRQCVEGIFQAMVLDEKGYDSRHEVIGRDRLEGAVEQLCEHACIQIERSALLWLSGVLTSVRLFTSECWCVFMLIFVCLCVLAAETSSEHSCAYNLGH